MATATAVPGVNAVRVLVNGGAPLGLFPGVDATVPLTRAALAMPNVPPTAPVIQPGGHATAATQALQPKLAGLGYLLRSGADGCRRAGDADRAGGVPEVAGPAADGPRRRAHADGAGKRREAAPIEPGQYGRRIEMLVDRQLVLAIEDDEVVRALDTSTGKPSTPTPLGSYSVYGKFARWWSVPFRE